MYLVLLMAGMILYGIKDDATVVGELLSDEEKDRQEIAEVLGKEVKKMIWPEESGEIVCGKQWDINFVPVKALSLSGKACHTYSTFIVISVM